MENERLEFKLKAEAQLEQIREERKRNINEKPIILHYLLSNTKSDLFDKIIEKYSYVSNFEYKSNNQHSNNIIDENSINIIVQKNNNSISQ